MLQQKNLSSLLSLIIWEHPSRAVSFSYLIYLCSVRLKLIVKKFKISWNFYQFMLKVSIYIIISYFRILIQIVAFVYPIYNDQLSSHFSINLPHPSYSKSVSEPCWSILLKISYLVIIPEIPVVLSSFLKYCLFYHLHRSYRKLFTY